MRRGSRGKSPLGEKCPPLHSGSFVRCKGEEEAVLHPTEE